MAGLVVYRAPSKSGGFHFLRDDIGVVIQRLILFILLEELAERDLKYAGHVIEGAGRYPICTLFVFLNLLERQAEPVSKRRLRHSTRDP